MSSNCIHQGQCRGPASRRYRKEQLPAACFYPGKECWHLSVFSPRELISLLSILRERKGEEKRQGWNAIVNGILKSVPYEQKTNRGSVASEQGSGLKRDHMCLRRSPYPGGPCPSLRHQNASPVFRSQYQMTGRQLRKYNWRLGLRPNTASGLQTYVTPKLMSMCLPALGSTRTRAIMKCAEQNKWASSRVPNLTLPPASSSPVRRPTGDLDTDPTASLPRSRPPAPNPALISSSIHLALDV